MKNKKLKLISIVLIGFLCILIGSPFINGETQTRTLLSNQCWGLSTMLQTGDTVNFRIESSQVSINVYIMDEDQMNFYLENPQDEASYYIYEYWHYFIITSSFVAQYNQRYYVLMINPSDSTSTYVVIDLTIDEYVNPTITITNPTNIDTFENGYNYITWTSTGSFDYVIIELYKDGYFLETISHGTPNSGSYSWYIYDNDDYIDDSDYQIKISDWVDDSIYDYSDYFTIEEPDPYDPYEPTDYSYIVRNIFFFVIIPTIIIGAVIVGYVIFKKKHPKEPLIQIKEIPKITYCPECGIKITDMTKDYCSQCGSKIIRIIK